MGHLYRRDFLNPKTKKMEPYPKWYGCFVDSNGKRKRVPLSTDKTVSQQMLSKLERKSEKEKAGLWDPFEEQGKRLILDHLHDWQKALSASGTTEKHQKLLFARASKVIDNLAALHLKDLSASAVMESIANLSTKHDWSPQTKAHVLQATKQFGRWLLKDRRWSENRIQFLSLPISAIRSGLRHDRRPFTQEEISYLITSVKASQEKRGLSGQARSVLYSLAASTGLRLSELASLMTSNFKGDWIALDAAKTKNRHKALVPIPNQLEGILRPFLTTCQPGRFLFGNQLVKDKTIGSKLLKSDMAEARKTWVESGGDSAADFLLWENDQNQFADFHSLRSTFITELARAGASPKELQTLARHSDPRVTLKHYTKVNEQDLVAMVNKLPVFTVASTVAE